VGPKAGLDVSGKGSTVQQINYETCGRLAESRPHLHTLSIHVTEYLCSIVQV